MQVCNCPSRKGASKGGLLRLSACVKTCLSVSLFVCMTMSFIVHRAAAQKSALRVAATAWMPEMSISGPIAVSLELANDGTSQAIVDLGEDEKEGISISAVSSNRRTYESTWIAKEGLALYGRLKIGPRSKIQRVLILQDWSINLPPGDYYISIVFKYRATVDGNDSVPLPSANLRLKVVPINASLIKLSCEAAARSYTGAGNASDALMAIGLLSKFSNPAALDCLSDSYYSTSPYRLAYKLLSAIGGINTEKSRAILKAIAQSGDAENSRLAAAELEKLEAEH